MNYTDYENESPFNVDSFEINVGDIVWNQLPPISIITPTENRKDTFALAIQNWSNFIYNQERMEWIIVDTAYDASQKVDTLLPKDPRIKYVYLHTQSPTASVSLGWKRNIANRVATAGTVRIHMDDDDVYSPLSLLMRIQGLLRHPDCGCVGCNPIAIYDVVHDQSSMLISPLQCHLPEASMAYTEQFWKTRGFYDNATCGESVAFLEGRENEVVSIRTRDVITAVNHTRNTTGEQRTKMLNQHEANGCQHPIGVETLQLLKQWYN